MKSTDHAQTAAASEINAAYYNELTGGKADYWKYMAAPRFRVERVVSLLKQWRPSEIADLGCGGGQLLAEIREAVPQATLTGIDISDAQIAANRGVLPGIDWHVANLESDAWAAEHLQGKFDAIVCTELIEHLERPERFLENALTLCRHGGKLIISTQSGKIRDTELRVGHVQHFSVEKMTGYLQAAGWSPVRVWNCGFPFHDLSKWYANLNPDKSMDQFAGASYGVVQRGICFALRVAFKLNSSSRGAQLFAVASRP